MLFEKVTSEELLQAQDYHLEYYRYSGDKSSYGFHFTGERHYSMEFEINGRNVTKPLILYKLQLQRNFLIDRIYGGEMRIFFKNVPAKKYETYELSRTYEVTIEIILNGFYSLRCNLYSCQIGAFYYCNFFEIFYKIYKCSKNPYESNDYIYIGFTKSHEYDNFVLKLIPKSNTNKDIFSIVVCPGPDWMPKSSNSDYIGTWENYLLTLKLKDFSKEYFLKYAYCHDVGVKTFVKCGNLKQKFLPSIDVGYQCEDYNNEEANRIYNKDKKNSVASLSGNELICKDTMLYESKLVVIAFLPPGNQYYNIHEYSIEKLVNQTKIYVGHRLHILNYDDFIKRRWGIENSFGYVLNYEAKCSVPTISANLRLKINGTVQGFENKIDEKFGREDIYTFHSREINNSSIGCHIVLDGFEHPAFKDFYGHIYSTSLMMFDETIKKYIKVDGVQNLVSNRKYKCGLIIKGRNSKIQKPDYIKETEFIINIIYEKTHESNTWIIFVISILVIVILLIGLLFLKKLKSKKKKPKSGSSTSSSTSQSTTKTSTVISKISNAPIIKTNNADKTCTKMAKTIATKNIVKNNKVTNFGQKVIGIGKNSNLINQANNTPKKVIVKNSNINLVNQAKNVPKKIVGKITNPTKINNVGDSVFKLK
uniref:6-cysteine protein n=1 Tax=Strongyloides venezuelensis TaxID=75913 RepID=A0A0K0EW82_STRVS